MIVVDDDTQYPPRLIETFVQWHHALPSAALALRGWVVNSEIVYLKFTDNYLVFGNEVREDGTPGEKGVIANSSKSFLTDQGGMVSDGDRWRPPIQSL